MVYLASNHWYYWIQNNTQLNTMAGRFIAGYEQA